MTNRSHSALTSTARSETGMYLVEMLVALLVGTAILLAVYATAMASYRASTTGQSQVLATNMAQQLIDNARNSTFSTLLAKLNGNIIVSEQVPLYSSPTGSSPLYRRALLRNPGLTYSSAAGNNKFNGTVTQTLINVYPTLTSSRVLQLSVDISWDDNTGNHTYSTSTLISENGIHN